jgi:hypothetical protein
MTAVVTSYIIVAPEGLKLSETIGLPVGIGVAIATFAFFLFKASGAGKAKLASENA